MTMDRFVDGGLPGIAETSGQRPFIFCLLYANVQSGV